MALSLIPTWSRQSDTWALRSARYLSSRSWSRSPVTASFRSRSASARARDRGRLLLCLFHLLHGAGRAQGPADDLRDDLVVGGLDVRQEADVDDALELGLVGHPLNDLLARLAVGRRGRVDVVRDERAQLEGGVLAAGLGQERQEL